MDVNRLRPLSLFEGVPDDQLAQYADGFKEIEMVGGTSLAKQDDYSYKFFIVLDGDVDVHRDFKFVARLGPGEFFGEMGLLQHEKRNARVTAHSRCTLACMMGWDFEAMRKALPSVGEQVDAIAAERAKSLDD